jgi:16S rRNA (guanine1207-N2)-methyltransferase
MNHYFTNNPDLSSKPKNIDFEINSHKFSFKTDNGVFCKNYLDEGSESLIKVLLKHDLNGRNLDVGCGYGPIGCVLAYFNPDSLFVLIDINSRACALSQVNATALHLSNVEVRESDIYQNVTGKFDNIFINPPIRAGKKTIYKMFEDAKKFLSINGSLYFVIRKSHGAESAQKFVQSIYSNCTLLKRDKGYYIYQAINEQIDN